MKTPNRAARASIAAAPAISSTRSHLPARRLPRRGIGSVSIPMSRALGQSAAYFVAGRLGSLLAIPPGYATAIWPAAGLALAAALLLGIRIWPGILLGSFAVNVGTAFDASTPVAMLR